MNLPEPDVGAYACVQGDGIPLPGSGSVEIDISGSVERAESDALACVTQAGSRTFGQLSEGFEQGYVIRDGETEIGLTLRTGSARRLLAVGQRVRVTVEDMPSGSSLLGDSLVLSVRDEADDRLLYWFAQTDRGPEHLALPAGYTAANAQLQCMYDWDCGERYRRGLKLVNGSEEVEIEIGGLANTGELAALLFDNTELVLGTDGTCFDIVAHHRMSVALFARDLVSKCDWLDRNECSVTDGCQAVHAYLASDTNALPTFIACVEEDSCGDGDALTCAVNDETAVLATFSTTCVPPGWTVAHEACDADADAGAP